MTLNQTKKFPKRKVHRAAVLAIAQIVALNPLLTYHTSALAQTCPDDGDSGEGSDQSTSTSRSTTDTDTEFDPAVATPGSAAGGATGTSSGSGNDGGKDGGDQGDGAAGSGDTSGQDGVGDDTPPPTGPGAWGDVGTADTWGDASVYGTGQATSTDEGSINSPVGGTGRDPMLPPLTLMHDPIDVGLADKIHTQVDYLSRGSAPLLFSRVYHSNASVNAARVTIPMGTGWHNIYDRSLQVISGTQVRLHRANGRTLDFVWNGSVWTSSLPAGVLTQIAGGWQYINHRNTFEVYNTTGRLGSLASSGLTTTLQYDGNSKLTSVANPFGRQLTFNYDATGRLNKLTLPTGANLSYSYDAHNNLVSTQFTDGSVRQYAYENTSFPNALTGIVDESGRRRVTWSYDSSGRPSQGYYGANQNTVNIAYNGSQVTTTDARGTQRTRSFTSIAGRVVLSAIQTAATVDSAATGWTLAYDGNGNVMSIQTRSGEVRQYVSDGRGRYMSLTRGAGTAQAMTGQTTWHSTFRRPIQTVDRGVTRNYGVDSVGRVTSVTRTTGAGTNTLYSAVYNAQNLVQSETDAHGSTKTYSYDTSGNLTSWTNALGQTTTRQNIDANGRALTIVRPDGVTITRTLDSRGRALTRTQAGVTMTYAYDAAGRVTSITQPDGSWESYSYDSAGLISGSSNHRGEALILTRDVGAKVTSLNTYSSTNAVALSATKQYNHVGRTATSTDSRGFSTAFNYASDGRISSKTDPMNLTRSVQFDVISRPIMYTQPNTAAMQQITGNATASTTLAYDGLDNRTSLTDVGAVTSKFAFDNANRKISETAPDPGNSTYTRNSAGDVMSITDPRGVLLTRTIDALGRTTAITPPSGTAISVTYLPNQGGGTVSQLSDPSGSTAWTYDSAGRTLTKKQITLGVARTLSVIRDTIGRPTSVTYPSGTRVDMTYTADGVASIAVGGTTLLNTITYRPRTRIPAGWHWGNGTSYSRSFDGDGRISAVTLGPTLRTYQYDSIGQTSSYTDQNTQGSTLNSFTYDSDGQLTGYSGANGTGGYSYDANGNRLSSVVNGVGKTYSYYAGTNRISAVTGDWHYTYNADGNPTTDGNYFSYTYDNFSRVSTATSTQSVSVSYLYNGLGQRVSKVVKPWTCSGGGNPNAVTNASMVMPMAQTCGYNTTRNYQYVYDDQGNLLGEYDNVTGAWQETVWFGSQPVAVVQASGTYYIDVDNIGTPRSIIRPSDNVEMWRWTSDPFGAVQPVIINGGNVSYNFRFPGQYYDPEVGTVYNGRRDYRPETGRFLQVDPSGLSAGTARYTYAAANPLRYADPKGLFSLTAQVGVAIINWLGFESNFGMFVTLPWNDTRFDVGFFTSSGIGTGLDNGTHWGLGAVKGDVNDLNCITVDANIALGPVSGTVMFDSDGLAGGTLGPSLEAGGSVLYSKTTAIGTGRNAKKNSCP